jgi:serine-type D-Ala-D-Ala carboxypeptidase/endopeptidase (penicillin-binding protein 4)
MFTRTLKVQFARFAGVMSFERPLWQAFALKPGHFGAESRHRCAPSRLLIGAVFFAAVLATGCTSLPATRPPTDQTTAAQAISQALDPWAGLPAALAQPLEAAQVPPAAVSFWVAPVSGGAVRLALNRGNALQPASVMKVLTSAVALDTLGPGHRGRAELRAASVLPRDLSAANTHEGDLVLRGLGHVEFTRDALKTMLSTVRAAGVARIKGDVLIDRLAYSPVRPDVGATAFDEAPEFRYNVIPDALSLNMNLLGLRLSSDAARVTAQIDPPLAGVVVKSELAINTATCPNWEDDWQIPAVAATADGATITLKGAFPAHCAASTELNLLDRTAYAQSLFRSVWAELGGTWQGSARELTTPPSTQAAAHLWASSTSRPLNQYLHDINKRSDNPITRMTFMALAGDAPQSQAKADQAVRDWLKARNIDATGLVLDNGSGLSRSERVSAQTLGEAMAAARRGLWGVELEASLPIAGTDGSMRNRLKAGPAFQRARIKTGTLRNTTSVAGFVRDANDQLLVVVGIINDDKIKASQSRPILDALIEWAAGSR